MITPAVAVAKELQSHYQILSARHVQAACRLIGESEPVLVIASELLPYWDLHALRENLPARALLRLALPGLDPADIAEVVRSVFRVLALPRPRAS